jgi:DNA processing protein
MMWRREEDNLLSPAQRLAILRLIRTDNVGPITFRQLVRRYGSAQSALDELPHISQRAGRPLVACTLSRAEDEFATIERLGARLVIEGDADYPMHLKHISAAPPVLTVQGGDLLNWQRSVGIVGARNASSAGVKMTRILTEGLGQAGFTIVSGLARGIDAAAHWAAIKTGTIGVLAGGLDRIYPREHLQLAEQIVDAGGALFSEMPIGWEPRAQDFPRRNRLVSGLSLGVVVVEAAKRSGSLITARLALEQNREVFAVPGSPLDPRAEGGNLLIQQGAHLVTSAQDIVAALEGASPARSALFEPEWLPEFGAAGDVEPGEDERARVKQALSTVPTSVDDILAETALTPAVLQILLLELDIAGDIEWSSGQLVALRF